MSISLSSVKAEEWGTWRGERKEHKWSHIFSMEKKVHRIWALPAFLGSVYAMCSSTLFIETLHFCDLPFQ